MRKLHMRKFLVFVLLAPLAAPLYASETVTSGPFALASPDDYANFNEGKDLLRGSFFNPTAIVVGSRLNVFISGGMFGSGTGYDPGWTDCDGDQTIRFYTDDIEDDLIPASRVSPCCNETSEVHYGLGNIVVPPWDTDVLYLFIDRTDNGGEFSEGDFKNVLLAISDDDGVTWDYPGHESEDCDYGGTMNPLLTRSSGSGTDDEDVSIFEVNMVSDGVDTLWGIMRFGNKTGSPKIGRIQIVKDSSRARGIRVDLMDAEEYWVAVDEDGTFDLDEADFFELEWPNVTPSSIYDTGSGYQLWGHKNDTSTNPDGCEDPYNNGRTIVYRTIEESGNTAVAANSFGTIDQEVTSTASDWPLPSENNYGPLFPARVDYDGDELIILSGSDRACWTLGQGTEPFWPGYTPFRGMEIYAVALSGSAVTPNDCNPGRFQGCLHDDEFGISLKDTYGNSQTAVKWSDTAFCFLNDSFGDYVDYCANLEYNSGSGYWEGFWSSATTGDYEVKFLRWTGAGTGFATFDTFGDYEGGTDDGVFFDP